MNLNIHTRRVTLGVFFFKGITHLCRMYEAVTRSRQLLNFGSMSETIV